MKRKYSKKNFDKTRKSTRNSEIFNIENLFNSMNDSLLPYVLIEKLDCVGTGNEKFQQIPYDINFNLL